MRAMLRSFGPAARAEQVDEACQSVAISARGSRNHQRIQNRTRIEHT